MNKLDYYILSGWKVEGESTNCYRLVKNVHWAWHLLLVVLGSWMLMFLPNIALHLIGKRKIVVFK